MSPSAFPPSAPIASPISPENACIPSFCTCSSLRSTTATTETSGREATRLSRRTAVETDVLLVPTTLFNRCFVGFVRTDRYRKRDFLCYSVDCQTDATVERKARIFRELHRYLFAERPIRTVAVLLRFVRSFDERWFVVRNTDIVRFEFVSRPTVYRHRVASNRDGTTIGIRNCLIEQ